MEVDADVVRIFAEHKKLLSKAVDDCISALEEQIFGSADRAHTVSKRYEGTSLGSVKLTEQPQYEIGLLEPSQDPSFELHALFPDDDEQSIVASEVEGKTPHSSKDGTEGISVLEGMITDAEQALFGAVFPRRQLLLDLLIGFIIIANTVVLLVELEYKGLAIEEALNSERTMADVFESERFRRQVFKIIETIFAIAYFLELIIRIAVLKVSYFKDLFNILDALLVLVTAASMISEWAMTNMILNVSFGRLVRLARLARSLRLLRTMRLFAGLRVMVIALAKILPKVWMMISVLFAFMIVGALVVGNLLDSFIADEAQDLDDRQWVWRNFGTAFWAFTTMFEITFSGGWPTKVRPVLEKVSKWYIVFFLPYIIVVYFAAMRITTAVILRETFELVYEDSMIVHDQTFKLHQKQLQTLKNVFETADQSHDGKITRDELVLGLENPDVKEALESLNFLPSEKSSLFDLLDDGDGMIGLDEFVAAVTRLKGTARSADIILIERELQKITELLHNMCSRPCPEGQSCSRPTSSIGFSAVL